MTTPTMTIDPTLASLAAARYTSMARAGAGAAAPGQGLGLLMRGADDASGVRLGIAPPLSEIAGLGARLAELHATLGSMREALSGPGAGQAQREITGLVSDIQGVGKRPGTPPADFDIRDIAAGIKRLYVRDAQLEPGEQRKVNLEITASAQSGGFYLSMGGAAIDLESDQDEFRIEVAGRSGRRALTFASGTSVSSIAAAINAFTSETSVRAIASGPGIRLESVAPGSADFVSVRILEDGGIGEADGVGVYDLAPDDATAARDLVATFSEARQQRTDYGQDMAALVNGVQAQTYGTELLAMDESLGFTAVLGLSTAAATAGRNEIHAQQLGTFHIFTLVDGRESAPTSPPPPPPTPPAQQTAPTPSPVAAARAPSAPTAAAAETDISRAEETLSLGAAALSILDRSGRLSLPTELMWLKMLADVNRQAPEPAARS